MSRKLTLCILYVTTFFYVQQQRSIVTSCHPRIPPPTWFGLLTVNEIEKCLVQQKKQGERLFLTPLIFNYSHVTPFAAHAIKVDAQSCHTRTLATPPETESSLVVTVTVGTCLATAGYESLGDLFYQCKTQQDPAGVMMDAKVSLSLCISPCLSAIRAACNLPFVSLSLSVLSLFPHTNSFAPPLWLCLHTIITPPALIRL